MPLHVWMGASVSLGSPGWCFCVTLCYVSWYHGGVSHQSDFDSRCRPAPRPKTATQVWETSYTSSHLFIILRPRVRISITSLIQRWCLFSCIMTLAISL